MIGAASRSLCVHGHLYQPPRENPFSGAVPREVEAEPFHDFNERITAECYRPNAELGNFSRINFDLGPTLAAWLEQHDPTTYRRILAQERMHEQRYGCSNALAQVYSHAIMPLASRREKRIQVAWGLADYRHRFGHKAPGVWLAETAADSETLSVLADYGVGFTVLSPWQAAGPIDPSEPYWVHLPDGRGMTVFFYCGELSGGVSFNAELTTNADIFSTDCLARHLNRGKLARGDRQLLLIATDGELYGHHQPFREHFLSHLVRIAAPAHGFDVTSLARYLRDNPPRREVDLIEPSAWSCSHGVDRWRVGCDCTEGEGEWKRHLRQALTTAASRVDALFEAEASGLLADPWPAEEEYIRVKLGELTPTAFWRRHARLPRAPENLEPALALLEGQYYRHLTMASCAFFFADLDRIEPRNAIANGLRALGGALAEGQPELLAEYEANLALARSWRTGRSGADILREIRRGCDCRPDLVGAA